MYRLHTALAVVAAALAIAFAPTACARATSDDAQSLLPVTPGGPTSDGDAGNGNFGNSGPCADGAKTTLKGIVYDPAGKTPLYNVAVFVPTTKLEPFSDALSCDRCGAAVSGTPHTSALSAADGSFTLEDVPAGDNIPLVIQVGRWRRQVVIPHVDSCKENTLTNPDLTRLPASQKEGDIPRIAVLTGAKDALECTLLRVGVSPSEFTLPGGSGRIHMYRSTASTGGAHLDGTTADAMPTGRDLYAKPEGGTSKLARYDSVLFDCEDGEAPETKTDEDRQNLVDYANAGGRVFTSHKSGNAWIEHGAAPFPDSASWGIACCGDTAAVNTTFPKGAAFADWLFDVHASVKTGELAMVEPLRSVSGVNAGSEAWLTIPDNGNVVEYAFNTPLGKPAAEQCGRVVFSNFHVIKSTDDYVAGTATDRAFPSGCTQTDLSQNELALAFLFFDLGSCIQDATQPPVVPK